MTEKEGFQLLNQIAWDLGVASPGSYFVTSPTKRFRYHHNYKALIPTEDTQGKKWAAWVMKRKGSGWVRMKIRFFAKRKSAEAQIWRWLASANKKHTARRIKRGEVVAV